MAEEKKIWFVKLETEYSGTDATYLEFGEKPNDEELYLQAKEHAESYENVWWYEDEEDFEDKEEYWAEYEQKHDENAIYSVEEYNPEEHDGHLYQEEIEKAKKWMNEMGEKNTEE
jgi:hypothetical protein